MSHPFEYPFILVETGRSRFATAEDANKEHEVRYGSDPHVRVFVDFELVKRVLAPFAEMHRPGCDESELACSRGTASDLTIITALEFKNAARLLYGKESE